jgi:hypothetical protein
MMEPHPRIVHRPKECYAPHPVRPDSSCPLASTAPNVLHDYPFVLSGADPSLRANEAARATAMAAATMKKDIW